MGMDVFSLVDLHDAEDLLLIFTGLTSNIYSIHSVQNNYIKTNYGVANSLGIAAGAIC